MFRYWQKSIGGNGQAQLLIPWLELHGKAQNAGEGQTAGCFPC